ncbi:MAG TPA: hypothetical protein VF711_01895 [Acidimicrobiales bacterium]|jgi:hypothetical protein
MITTATTTTDIEMPRNDFVIDDAQLAAVAFLARYSARVQACRTYWDAPSGTPRGRRSAPRAIVPMHLRSA